MKELTYASATTLAHSIRNRGVSSLEVVQAHLHHIEKVNPRLNAVVQLGAEQALDQARAADTALAVAAELEHALGGWQPPPNVQ